MGEVAKMRDDGESLEQATGIVKSQALRFDFIRRRHNIERLRTQKKELEVA
jgi:hypothetical protein